MPTISTPRPMRLCPICGWVGDNPPLATMTTDGDSSLAGGAMGEFDYPICPTCKTADLRTFEELARRAFIAWHRTCGTYEGYQQWSEQNATIKAAWAAVVAELAPAIHRGKRT